MNLTWALSHSILYVMNSLIGTSFINAVHSTEPVSGLTHTFYRYPARFSPLFARAAIEAFTKPGEIVLDPFMGGGTTLVEARTLGRRAIGTDINSLAVFVSNVKITPLSDDDLSDIQKWVSTTVGTLNLRNPAARATEWEQAGYQRNINDKSTWQIRKILELALARLDRLNTRQQQRFARCLMLKTAQWALDCRTHIPTAEQFRQQISVHLNEMTAGAKDYARAVKEVERLYDLRGSFRTLCLNRSAIGLENDSRLKNRPAPALILTSPPYPGVHVLYHRWQVNGRRETPAPFWITDSLDGNGSSFYTLGDRKQPDLTAYYQQALAAFGSLANMADNKTILVQMLAFSDPSWQLDEYLSMMKQSGFKELKFRSHANSSDGRIWRYVPNRKWYASQRNATGSSKEVVLFHQLS
jgi:hypothetical protein